VITANADFLARRDVELRRILLEGRRFLHSDFVIPSDFVIRHSDLRILVCSIKRPVQGTGESVRGA